jgi:Uri superfamily endonuclease
MISIPSSPGTYALILRLERPVVIRVGRLGEFQFPACDTVYLGSALGPGGLRARLGRHLRGGGRPHWHIDTFRPFALVRGFCYSLSTSPMECRWTRLLARQSGAWFPATGFGASDCRARPLRCPAHLVAFSEPLFASELSEILANADFLAVEVVDRY